ncbi:hypothetical protein ACWDBP_34880 [Streptomyces sp. NPDC001233]|uniref:hypothetical protein n=1 Tax=Streptomyces sp. NPDC002589 TaxID=3154420 RepID=UPI003333178A
MSIQLMWAAAHLPASIVNPQQKLALMKICDSADDETRTAEPAVAGVAAWVGVPDGRVLTIFAELVAKGLVERVETGRAGRAAGYRVFPHGVPAVGGAARS